MYRGLTLTEIVDLVNDSDFEDNLSENEDIDVVCPPEVDRLTDVDEGSDELIGTADVHDVPGPLEVHFCQSQKNVQEDKINVKLSSRTGKSKKRRLTEEKSDWVKSKPNYTKLQDRGKDAEIKMENLKKNLQHLSPREVFEKFFHCGIYEHIVKESVRYAATEKNESDFVLSPEEVKVFIGFLLLTGYHKLPSERMYWSDEDDLSVDVVKQAMPRNTFLKLKKIIHFCNNDLANDNKTDKGFKIRPLIQLINKYFQQFGIFEEFLAVDEMIVKYYGHNNLKQFIKGKPIRFGYKLWALCGSSGYCFNFDIYCGKNQTEVGDDLLLGSRVVLKMLEAVKEPKSHTVFFDNFFTNRDLLIYLGNRGYRATGTLREARTGDCPLKASKEMKKEQRGFHDYMYDKTGEVLFVRWNDNRSVTIGTNFDTIEPEVKVSRWSREAKQRVTIRQPQVVRTYNAYMGGVDHHDWLVGKYAIGVRGKKWYWPIFTRIIDMAMVNAWILYRNIHGKEACDLLSFRRAVTIFYLKVQVHARNVRGRPLMQPSSHASVVPDVRFDQQGHTIARRDKQRRCALEGCSSKPRTYCKKCSMTLCIDCFGIYHKK